MSPDGHFLAEPPLVLAFDTAAARCAAAVVRGEAILARRDEAMERGQAERLFPMIEEMLEEAGVRWTDLDGIGVVTGPGNFTGVRLAVAAARGLAMALGIPAVGVTVFEALAEGSGADAVTLADKRGRFTQPFRDGAAVGPPAPADDDAPGDPTPADPVVVARVAMARLAVALPPAPLYLRAADAVASSDPVPVLLDDA